MSEPTGARRYGTGGGDAYYDAVKYGGYTGTREQFGRDQAEFAENAAAVAEAKEVVEQDKEEVQNTKETFENTTVPEAIQAIQNEGTTQVTAVTQKGEEVSQQVETVGTEQKDAVANEGRARVKAVQDEGDTQVQAVTDEGTRQIGLIESAGSTQIENVNSAGTAQVEAVNSAGAAQVQAVGDKGDEVLESIPADYTELTEEVDNLNRQISDITETGVNVIYFTDANDRTFESGLSLSFDDQSSIELNGPVGSSIISLPMLGNTTFNNSTLRVNLPAGTYTYHADITTGSGATSGTALYYRTSTDGSNQGLTLWNNNTTNTFEDPVELVYRISANRTFTGRICKLMIMSGTEVPSEYIPYKETAIDSTARQEITSIKNSIAGNVYRVPTLLTPEVYYTEQIYTTYEMQGICTDGTFLYFSMHGALDTDNAVVGKINLETGALVSQVSNHAYGHVNGMCYNPNNNTLLIADTTDRTGKIYVVDADTLDYVSEFTLTDVIKTPWENYSFGEFAGIGAVGYSTELSKFVFLIRKATNDIFWGFAVTDNNFKLEKLIKCQNLNSFISTRGGLDCDSDYIYMCEQQIENNVRTAKIVIYNYAGNIISSISLSGLGYTIEGVCRTADNTIFISHSNNIIRKCNVISFTDISVLDVLKQYNFN